MAQKTQFHLNNCPSNTTGLSENCSCEAEVRHYLNLAKWSFGLFIFEIVGGLLSGSMALISDAVHVLADGTENVINIVVSQLSRKSNNEERIRKIGGLISGLLLFAMGVWIIYEGLERFISPHHIEWYMTLVAIAGLGANLRMQWLHKNALPEHRNIQHFWQDKHLWSDIGASIAVIIGGIFMLLSQNLYWIDGALSIAIGLLIVTMTSAKLLGFEVHSHKHQHAHTEHNKCDHEH